MEGKQKIWSIPEASKIWDKEGILIVTKAKTPRWYLMKVVYDAMLLGRTDIVLSTLHKNKYMVECLKPFLKVCGWELDDSLEENPYEEVARGDRLDNITIIKYKFVRSAVSKAILEDELKEEKSKDIMVYLLDRIRIDNKERDFNKW